MAGPPRRLHLGAFLFNVGNHIAAWRLGETDSEGLMSLGLYRRLAAAAERGCFDFLFLSDGLGINDDHDAILRRTVTIRPEPLTLLSALAAVTERIGLAATISTTYNEPYHVARAFATIDHLSGGRAALNIVTSSTNQEAQNFGRDEHVAHAERYRRAQEFVTVLRGLWDTWQDGALVVDRASGTFADPALIRHLNHRGPAFAVRGPLNVPRPPQGHPVVIQAGASEAGRDLATREADIIFVVHRSLDSAVADYAATKALVAGHGRAPDSVKILPGVMPIVASTQAEARRREAELNDLLHPAIAIAYLSDQLQHDFSAYDPDGPLPDLPDFNGERGRARHLAAMAREEGLSLAEVGRRAAINRGHLRFVGAPEQVADEIARWFAAHACDGFNILPPWHPGALEDFVDQVVPELQRRGLFRTAYEGRTLREHLGLPRP